MQESADGAVVLRREKKQRIPTFEGTRVNVSEGHFLIEQIVLVNSDCFYNVNKGIFSPQENCGGKALIQLTESKFYLVSQNYRDRYIYIYFRVLGK